jgi:hypothetical protein
MSVATVDRTLIDLRATVAMRSEDLRIATLHREQAGARHMSSANHAAYCRCVRWEDHCREQARQARAALIVALGGAL